MDGRRDALFNQVFGPLESVVEMNSSRLFMAEQLYLRYRAPYEALFGPMPPLDDAEQFPPLAAALTGCQPLNSSAPLPTCDGTFHGSPSDHAEFDGMTAANQDAVTRVVANAGKAIGAFERRLTCGPGAFDAWLHGGPALAPEAQRGAALFVGKAGCVACHAGPFFTDQSFHNVGLMPGLVQQTFTDAADHGAATGSRPRRPTHSERAARSATATTAACPRRSRPSLEGTFRTPSLRCAVQRPSFMHTGQLRSLAQVVAFFNRGGDSGGFPGQSELRPLGLSDDEQAELVAFLEALDGPGADARYTHAP